MDVITLRKRHCENPTPFSFTPIELSGGSDFLGNCFCEKIHSPLYDFLHILSQKILSRSHTFLANPHKIFPQRKWFSLPQEHTYPLPISLYSPKLHYLFR